MKVLAISREAFDSLGYLSLESIGAVIATAGNAITALLADTALDLPEVE